MWLSGLSAGLRTKGSLVPFPIRAHAWVVCWVPSGGASDRQPHIDVSLPLFLPPFPPIKIKIKSLYSGLRQIWAHLESPICSCVTSGKLISLNLWFPLCQHMVNPEYLQVLKERLQIWKNLGCGLSDMFTTFCGSSFGEFGIPSCVD